MEKCPNIEMENSKLWGKKSDPIFVKIKQYEFAGWRVDILKPICKCPHPTTEGGPAEEETGGRPLFTLYTSGSS